MEEKKQLFYGKILIEIYHVANTPVVTVSSKNHFWSLKLRKKSICQISK